MAIWLNNDSKILVQGMTGSEGTKHTSPSNFGREFRGIPGELISGSVGHCCAVPHKSALFGHVCAVPRKSALLGMFQQFRANPPCLAIFVQLRANQPGLGA